MNGSNGESGNGEGGKRNWLSITNMVITLVFGILLTGWLQITDRRVSQNSLEISRYGTAANYIGVLGDDSSPPYLKSLALASMLRFELVEPDLLFSTGYMTEDRLGPGILQQLMYEFGKNWDPIDSPIGYVDLPGKRDGDDYLFDGCTIDDRRLARITVVLGDLHGFEVTELGGERKDIASLYPRYAGGATSGFEFRVPAAGLPGSKHRLTVRIIDDDFHFMQILNTEICFSEEAAVHAAVAEHCGVDDEGGFTLQSRQLRLLDPLDVVVGVAVDYRRRARKSSPPRPDSRNRVMFSNRSASSPELSGGTISRTKSRNSGV